MCEHFLPQNQREEGKAVFAGNTDRRVTSYLSSGKVGPHKKKCSPIPFLVGYSLVNVVTRTLAAFAVDRPNLVKQT